ncbi:hypothetical protein ACIA98_01310 [Streptomyces sp. NPDC051366]|uniref:hypothetical protein n=1 Tax=Streptomyces sp. NPDC051366 TaxID=3365652 RepID=UPI003793106F
MATAAEREATRVEPVPVPGCGVCLALDSDRKIAWDVGNLAAVAVQNAELRNHPHRQGTA